MGASRYHFGERVDDSVSDEDRARAEQRVGDLLRDKWRLDRLLGIGGTAAVYAASHRNGLKAAVKILHPALSAQRQARKRFLREGYAANTVQHDGVVQVLDDDETSDGAVFLVMELLDGASVATLARARGGRLAPTEVVAIGERLLDLLAAAHDKRIWHRDVKPENLFVTRDGVLKLLDFGLAKVEQAYATHPTSPRAILGTPLFMSPEQALGRWDEVDAQSDLWAAGATLLHLWSGKLVHVAENAAEALVVAATKAAPLVKTIDASIPDAVAAVLDRALSFHKAQRWPDARSMRTALLQAHPRYDLSTVMQVPDGVEQAAPKVRTQVLGTPPAARGGDPTLVLEPDTKPPTTTIPLADEVAVPPVQVTPPVVPTITEPSVPPPLPTRNLALEWLLLGGTALVACAAILWLLLREEAPAPVEAPPASAEPAPTAKVEEPQPTPSLDATVSAAPPPTPVRAAPPSVSASAAPSAAPPKSDKVFSDW